MFLTTNEDNFDNRKKEHWAMDH